MRVVQINAVYYYSSTGRNTENLHKFLLKHHEDSYVFCTNIHNPQDGIFKLGNKFSWLLHGILSRISGLQGYYSFFSTHKLIKSLDNLKPDVVLLGNMHSNYINIPLLFRYLVKYKIATANVLHDCWTFTGHCCHYTKIGCEKWKTSCKKCPLLKEDNISYWDRSNKCHKDKKKWFGEISNLGVIGVSDWITEEAKKSAVFPRHTIFKRIYNWIDLDIFHPLNKEQVLKELQLPPYTGYAISVSQLWNDAKGLNLILKLATDYPNVGFILVGEIDNNSILPKNIISTGRISDATQLCKYYNAANVYLNLSRQETFGKVSAEALACGIPILSGNATASPEVCGDCGLVVNLDKEDSVSISFGLLISGKVKISQDKCRYRAEQLFNKDANLKEYYDFLFRLSADKNEAH